MHIIDGKLLANSILKKNRNVLSNTTESMCFVAILVGNNSASELYVNMKQKALEGLNISFKLFHFYEKSDEQDIIRCIHNANFNCCVDGILVQLPLPEHLDTQEIINSICSEKDVDALRKDSLFVSPFIKSMQHLYRVPHKKIAGMSGVIITNSVIFGNKMSRAMQDDGIDTTVVLRKNFDKAQKIIKTSDIVVTAVGVPGLIKGSMLKNSAIVIDGGIEKKDGNVVGDVDAASIETHTDIYLSPVPGGVGPATVASLVENVVIAIKLHGKL